MDFREDSSRFGLLPIATSRTVSSSSSTFFSANQSPFFSPSSSTCQRSSSIGSDVLGGRLKHRTSSTGISDPEALDANVRFILSNTSQTPAAGISGDSHKFDHVSSSTGLSNSAVSVISNANDIVYSGQREKQSRHGRSHGTPLTPSSVSLSTNRLRSCDVFIGLHGRKPSLLRFANWLFAELECQGISCFISDRSRCRNSRKHGIVERAMDVSTFGVVILTRKSFRNPYTIEELRFFSSKKNLVPVFFDLSPGDCLVRDIVEKRGELWEKHGGELWVLYGGVEKEWKEAVGGLARVHEWKLECQDGRWRDCIIRAVTLLAMKLGRRSVAERLAKWKEKADKEEFPFPRNENFIGRNKELSELEFILFGDISGDSERDYFDLKARPRRKNLTIGWKKSNLLEERRKEHQLDEASWKGKEPVVWKESEKEIEMSGSDFRPKQYQPRQKPGGRYVKRKRSTKILYGKGIACVSGDSGIGKTELLLEFAYRYHQRYKMVLWIGGESRYIRQNYLNLWSFLEVDVGIENTLEKSRIKSFEEHEDSAVSTIRRELMRNIPFLIVIDNLENEKDWWDHKLVMDLLPRFGGETHIIISTRLPRVMNLEPLKLSFLSGVEALQLMQGGARDHSLTEIDALRVIEEKVGRLTLGLAIVGSILSELPINPSRLLDTINRMPLRDLSWSGKERTLLRRNTFILQLLEVCFSIFDHADGPRSLATKMVQASACFLLLGFGTDPVVVELKVSELLYFVKEVALPLAVRTFITFSRCSAAIELLRLCTDALEAADQTFVTPVDKWLDKSLCWRPVQTNAQLNPCLWQELALLRATVLETRAKLMLRGGHLDIADDLIRKAIFVRTSIYGEDHPTTVSARETLSKITRNFLSVQEAPTRSPTLNYMNVMRERVKREREKTQGDYMKEALGEDYRFLLLLFIAHETFSRVSASASTDNDRTKKKRSFGPPSDVMPGGMSRV
ncbi:hypothetical protein NL676_011232 [Syzygium grande]|nr:hypothetical protein NL676_011232 [Syzygium grande]